MSIEEQCSRVDIFAKRMKSQLRRHAGKGDWRQTMASAGDSGPMLLMSRVWEEIQELDSELSVSQPDADRVLDVAAGAANLLLMVADLIQPLERS